MNAQFGRFDDAILLVMKQFSIKMLKKKEKTHTESRCVPGNRSRSSGFVARHANH